VIFFVRFPKKPAKTLKGKKILILLWWVADCCADGD
jgi:hypothetical protein